MTTILNHTWKVIRLTHVIYNHELQSFQDYISSCTLHYVDTYSNCIGGCLIFAWTAVMRTNFSTDFSRCLWKNYGRRGGYCRRCTTRRTMLPTLFDKECILDGTWRGVSHPCIWGSNCPFLPFSFIDFTIFLFFYYFLFSNYSIVFLIIIIKFNLFQLYLTIYLEKFVLCFHPTCFSLHFDWINN